MRLLNKSKSNNYTEVNNVNVADRWRERLRSYPGRSHGHGKTNTRTVVETRFIVRSQPKP